jgi:hypothetical protein
MILSDLSHSFEFRSYQAQNAITIVPEFKGRGSHRVGVYDTPTEGKIMKLLVLVVAQLLLALSLHAGDACTGDACTGASFTGPIGLHLYVSDRSAACGNHRRNQRHLPSLG